MGIDYRHSLVWFLSWVLVLAPVFTAVFAVVYLFFAITGDRFAYADYKRLLGVIWLQD